MKWDVIYWENISDVYIHTYMCIIYMFICNMYYVISKMKRQKWATYLTNHVTKENMQIAI